MVITKFPSHFRHGQSAIHGIHGIQSRKEILQKLNVTMQKRLSEVPFVEMAKMKKIGHIVQGSIRFVWKKMVALNLWLLTNIVFTNHFGAFVTHFQTHPFVIFEFFFFFLKKDVNSKISTDPTYPYISNGLHHLVLPGYAVRC